MSGFEIAGVLLGSIPLVISALEHYKNGLDIISDLRNYRSILKSLKTKLRIQEELYRGTLQRLLLPELSPYEMQSLFSEGGVQAGPSLWGTKEIEDKLHRSLGAKYEVFINVVVDMNMIMEKLIKKLDIDLDGKPRWSPKTSTDGSLQNRFEWEWRRIRRSFGKTEREQLISSFERYNSDLASFVQTREILAPNSDGRAIQFVKHFGMIRRQAYGLHGILESSWQCSCTSTHTAYLRLNHPAEVTTPLPPFGVTFPCQKLPKESETLDSQDGAFWRHTVVSMSKSEREQDSPSEEFFSTTLTLTTVRPTPQTSLATIGPQSTSTSIKEKKVRKVQFARTKKTVDKLPILDSNPHRDSSVLPAAQELPGAKIAGCQLLIIEPTPTQSTASTGPISLCKILQTLDASTKFLGSFPNATTENIASITGERSSNPSKACDLGMLISNTGSALSNHHRLSDKSRLQIAVKLSSAVLQLYDSPWLNNVWDRSDIHFLLSRCAEDHESAIDGPFVTACFQEDSILVPPKPNKPPEPSRIESHIPSKTLFALAVMLIELCLDKTLAEMRGQAPETTPESRKPTLLEDYETANEQLDAVYQRSGSNYGDVVQRCLKCEFSITPRQKRLDFETFRHLVYEGVVAPLEDNYKKYLLYRGNN